MELLIINMIVDSFDCPGNKTKSHHGGLFERRAEIQAKCYSKKILWALLFSQRSEAFLFWTDSISSSCPDPLDRKYYEVMVNCGSFEDIVGLYKTAFLYKLCWL